MSNTRYYVIGNSTQVMKENWLSPFPTDPKEVKEMDIFNSLKPRKNGKPFVLFNNLEIAKQCAAIKTSNDNMTVSAVSTHYRPVIEVSLVNEDKLHLESTHLKISDGCRLRLDADAFHTDSSNIKHVYSYCYRAGAREHKVTLDDPVDLQKVLTPSSKCILM